MAYLSSLHHRTVQINRILTAFCRYHKKYILTVQQQRTSLVERHKGGLVDIKIFRLKDASVDTYRYMCFKIYSDPTIKQLHSEVKILHVKINTLKIRQIIIADGNVKALMDEIIPNT